MVNQIKHRKREKEIKIQKTNVAIAKSGKYPHINLIAQYNLSGSQDVYGESWNDLKVKDWRIMLTATYSIYDGFATKHKLEETSASLEAARIKFEEDKQIIVQDVQRAYQKLQNTNKRINIMQKNLSMAKENIEKAYLQYKIGTIASSVVDDYQMALQDASIKLIEAKIDFKIAEAQLIRAMGIKSIGE